MNIYSTKVLGILALLIFVLYTQNNAQTAIKTGNISGIWSKQFSPYIIEGDINIASGKTLTIKPGVKIEFTGPFVMNVQGSLIAEGTVKDSIYFGMNDTTGIKTKNRLGWNGIHFDRRPVNWDTLKFRLPEDEEIRKMLETRISSKNLDTSMKISLVMKIPDLVNDNIIADSIFSSRQGSRLSYCRFEYATSEGRQEPYIFGGAVYIYRYSNLIINNCLFQNNSSYAGGAIFCKEAAPVIMNNRIMNCNAQSSGGAMAFVFSGPVILNNTITENESGYNGGAVLFHESSPYVVNNIIIRNKAGNYGGAIACDQKTSSYLGKDKYAPVAKVKFPRDPAFDKINSNVLPLKNANNFYGRFINNIICDNKAACGGGMALNATAPELTNITLCNNSADTIGGGILCEFSSPRITNSILYGNVKSQLYLVGECFPCFSYCNIESGTSGIRKDSTCKNSYEFSNICSVSPKFKSGDYGLNKDSECSDAGTPDTSSLMIPAKDLIGKDRIVNDRIDLGALEYSGNRNKKSTEENQTINNEIDQEDSQIYTIVFPNPNHGIFSIIIRNNIYKNIVVEIYSQSGNKIYMNNYAAENWFEQQIDLSDYAEGVYVIVVRSKDIILLNSEIILNQ